jgi:hypothetical protein
MRPGAPVILEPSPGASISGQCSRPFPGRRSRQSAYQILAIRRRRRRSELSLWVRATVAPLSFSPIVHDLPQRGAEGGASGWARAAGVGARRRLVDPGRQLGDPACRRLPCARLCACATPAQSIVSLSELHGARRTHQRAPSGSPSARAVHFSSTSRVFFIHQSRRAGGSSPRRHPRSLSTPYHGR